MCEHIDYNAMQYPSQELPKSKAEYRRLKEIAARVEESLFAVYDIRVDGRYPADILDIQSLIHERVWWDWGEAAVLLSAASFAPYGLVPPDGFRRSEVLAKERDLSGGTTYLVSYTDRDFGKELVAIIRKTPDRRAQKICERGSQGLLLTHKAKPMYSFRFRAQGAVPSECYSLDEIRNLLGTGKLGDLAQRLVFQNAGRMSNRENVAAVIGYQASQPCPCCGRVLYEMFRPYRREVRSVWGLWSVAAYPKQYVCRRCAFHKPTLDEAFIRGLLARHCFRSAFVFGRSGVIDPLDLVRAP
jgi:hypothetical protein